MTKYSSQFSCPPSFPLLPIGDHAPRAQALQEPPWNAGLLLRFLDRVLEKGEAGRLPPYRQDVAKTGVGGLGGRADADPNVEGGGGGGRGGGRGGGGGRG